MRKLILAMLFGLWSSCAAAGIYWLPDYLKDNIDTNHRTDTDTGGGDIPLGCEKYSPQCSSPHILGGIEIRVAGDLFCPMECICPDSFRYTTANCSGDKKPAGSACDGKYNDCRALTCEEKGQKTCNGSCIAKSACCTDSDCGSDQKCSSGSCVVKTCEDKGQKTCNGSCIAKSACCTDNECGSDQKCSSGSCIAQTCEDKGQKTCNGSCIAASACCTDTDCGSGKKCSSGSCIAKSCEEMGQKTCNGKCIAKTACCVSGDCASGMKCFDNICIAQTCEEKGLKTCNGSCIAVSACCMDTDCGSGKKCSSGSCVAKSCEEMGQKTCNSKCIAKTACCTDTDCGSGKKCQNGSCVDSQPKSKCYEKLKAKGYLVAENGAELEAILNRADTLSLPVTIYILGDTVIDNFEFFTTNGEVFPIPVINLYDAYKAETDGLCSFNDETNDTRIKLLMSKLTVNNKFTMMGMLYNFFLSSFHINIFDILSGDVHFFDAVGNYGSEATINKLTENSGALFGSTVYIQGKDAISMINIDEIINGNSLNFNLNNIASLTANKFIAEDYAQAQIIADNGLADIGTITLPKQNIFNVTLSNESRMSVSNITPLTKTNSAFDVMIRTGSMFRDESGADGKPIGNYVYQPGVTFHMEMSRNSNNSDTGKAYKNCMTTYTSVGYESFCTPIAGTYAGGSTIPGNAILNTSYNTTSSYYGNPPCTYKDWKPAFSADFSNVFNTGTNYTAYYNCTVYNFSAL